MGEMMNQMSVLLEMLQAAKADDMDALADAEARATKNKERMRRQSHQQHQQQQKKKQSEDRHAGRRGHGVGRDGVRDGKSGRDRDRGSGGAGAGGKGRRKRDEPPTDSESSSDQDRDQRAAAAAAAAIAEQEQDREHHQRYGGGGGRAEENGYHNGPLPGGQVPPAPAGLDTRNLPYPDEWEDDSRDMTRAGDSVDLTRTTNDDYAESAAGKDDELYTRQTGTTATMTNTGTSSSHHAAHNRRGSMDHKNNNNNNNNNGVRGSAGQKMPLKPPAPSRGERRSRSDEGPYGRIEQDVSKLGDNDSRRRSDLDEPFQPRQPSEREVEKDSVHPSPDGTGRQQQQRSKNGTSDWGETEAEHYMQQPLTNREMAARASFGSQGDLDDDLSRHTREEMGPPIGDKEQASSNVDADIQSRVLRQLENDDDDGRKLINDDNEDDEYYDSDESSEISDITSPTFATYQDPPTVCDDGSIKGVRYGPGSRFAGMTAAQVAAHANREVNKRHRADGKSVESDDEKSRELEKRLHDDSAVDGKTGTDESADQPSSADGRPGLDDRPPPPSLAGDLKPPSMRSMISAQLKQQQQQQQQLQALREQQEQHQIIEEEKAEAEAAIGAAERQREEEERIEAEKRRREEEEEALKRADQEARDRARARQQERREKQKREMLHQQRQQEEMLAQQLQDAIAEKEQLQEEPQQSQPLPPQQPQVQAQPPPPPQTSPPSPQPSPPQQQQQQQQRQLRHSIAAPERVAAGRASLRSKPAPGTDPNKRSLRLQPGRAAQPQQRRPAARRPTQPSSKPNAPQQMQRPERAQRTVSAPSRQQQQQLSLRGSRRHGDSKMAAALAASKGKGVSPTFRGEAHPFSSPDKSNRSGSSSGKSGGSERSGIRRFSDIGSLLKAKARFKGARNGQGAQSAADIGPHAADKASGRGHTRRKSNERESGLLRVGLLGASTAGTSTTYRKPIKTGQRNRPSRKGGPWAESAAWKQPIREEDVDKNCNPNNVDIEKMMNSMGKDIDFIFRELSVLEGQQEQTHQQKTAAVGADLPPDLPSEQNSDGSDSDEGSLIATAKIKYTLGSLATTLKQDEKGPGGRRARKSRVKRQEQDGPPYKNSQSLPVPPTSEAPTSGVASKSADPLLIDEDGFIVSPSSNGPAIEGTFGTPDVEDVGGGNDKKGRRSTRTTRDQASGVASRGKKVAPGRSARPGSDLMAEKRRELQGYQDKQKVRPSQNIRQKSDDDSTQDSQSLDTTDPDKVEADVAKQVMALAAGKKVKVRGSTARSSARKDHGGDDDDDDDSIGFIPSNVPDLDKGERNFSTMDYEDDDDDISKIDAVEAATKKRIEMLRQVVAEKAAQLSAIDDKPSRGGAGHAAVDDDELTHKLDFVEQETMKQISRLRRRYSTRNVNAK